MKIKIAIPARDQVDTGFAQSLASMTMQTCQHPEVTELGVQFCRGTLIVNQRRLLAQALLDEGGDWLLFLDSDMRFSPDTLKRLLAHGVPFVACNYPTRRMPIEPTAYRRMRTQEHIWTNEESSGLEECAGAGLGVTLIHRTVFERTPKPWFHIPYLPEADAELGEDLWFCNQIRKAGFAVMLDHDLSKEIRHIGVREFSNRDTADLARTVHEIPAQEITKWRPGTPLTSTS
jgi:hypothetical protein